MKQILFSLQWLQEACTGLYYDAEKLRQHANSIEAMAQAWLKVPVALMSTGQQLIAALDIIERLLPSRLSEAKRLESALRMRQHSIQKHYSECNLERDSEQYDIEDRAAFFGKLEKPRFAERFADVMIAHAQAAMGNKTIDNYLLASVTLTTIEAKSMVEVCGEDPTVLLVDNLFFKEKLLTEEKSATVEKCDKNAKLYAVDPQKTEKTADKNEEILMRNSKQKNKS